MKFTLQQFKEAYPDDNACLDKIFNLRYGHLKDCPKCKLNFQYYRVKTVSKIKKQQRKCYECAHCGYQLYPLANTPFHKTRVPLTYWFMAIFLQTTTRNGVSAKELQRALGVTYKCAFRIGHQVRILMTANKPKQLVGGIVEIDELYVTSNTRFMNKKRKDAYKQKREMIVIGMVQRDGQVITKVVDSTGKDELMPVILDSIDKSSKVYTDSASIYPPMLKGYAEHSTVDHSKNEWVRGTIHSNTVEGFFSQVNRTINTHVKVTRKYLQRYTDECAFRYMNRNKQGEMFDTILQNVCLSKSA